MLQKFETADAFLSHFDKTKKGIQDEIRAGFFNEDGSLKMSEDQIQDWLADRAIDEFKIVHELSLAMSQYGHTIPPYFTAKLTEQMGEEMEHFQIIRNLLPPEKQAAVDQRMQSFGAELQGDVQYHQFVEALREGDIYGALMSINITHEGYSAAAIEVLKDIPINSVKEAYGIIGADEAKHHEAGREMVGWLIEQRNNTPQISAATKNIGSFAQAAQGAPSAMAWSWPAPVDKATGAMAWSWPAPVDKTTGAMAWSWPAPVDKATGAMAWSWPAPVDKATGAMAWSWPAPVDKKAVGAMAWSWPAPATPQVSWKMPALKVA